MSSQTYEHLYLAPHLDDAVLSCGGRIYQQRRAGQSVAVLTLLAGDPPPEAGDTSYVQELHARWGMEPDINPVQVRRAEDKAALSVLGVEGLYWDWPDCIYRRHPETGRFLYTSETDLFGPVHPAETGLRESISRRLAMLPLARGGQVYAPLGAGGHIDHRLVRQAAEDWWASQPDSGGILSGHSAENIPEAGAQSASKGFSSQLKSLIYYEDYPYTEQAECLVAVLGDGHWWRAERTPLDEPSMAAKIAAVARYRSQISTFFQDLDEMAERLRAYARRAGSGAESAERYWHKKKALKANIGFRASISC